ncbi:hypothetical protein [Zhihengliuella halotolerans]|uniref:hypothetical protein n=1 Tax=Zhihengliuella halotolerans TaxID=370736 RepID=UPI000C7FCDBC|nr:hypothetical protein [Zhihengliuella halotolerans]
MKSHVLHTAIGALWGALVFFVAFFLRNVFGDPQALGDQSIMLVGLILIGAVATAVGRARRSTAMQNRAASRPDAM